MARILLADDDKATRDLVKRMLEADGHTVDIAQDGAEALEQMTAAGSKINLLVTDVHMPGLDGLTLAARAAGAVPGLGILLMSGFPEELEKAKSVNGSRIRTLSKPFTLEQVKTSVRALLG